LSILRLRLRPKQSIDQYCIATDSRETMPHRPLDPRPGKARMMGVSLALDRVIDDADGGPGTHVHGADGVQKKGCMFLEHGLFFP